MLNYTNVHILGIGICLMFLKMLNAHQGYMYLLINTVKRVVKWNTITDLNNWFKHHYSCLNK